MCTASGTTINLYEDIFVRKYLIYIYRLKIVSHTYGHSILCYNNFMRCVLIVPKIKKNYTFEWADMIELTHLIPFNIRVY